ncbi:MAG: (5-formylfuran-3-yl)methyl phosphate synthase [Gammaproteobacteria bacterium]|jgi:(5-formylfuran-3-yl)methyl phosphate synthase
MTALLASVSSTLEAVTAMEAGVDVIDLKNPAAGALGAVSDTMAREVVARVDGRVPVSATVGDLPLLPPRVVRAVAEKAATGVDYVKLGLFGDGDMTGTLSALQPIAGSTVKLVAVLFADRGVDLDLLPAIAEADFAGAMLDTADKRAGGLRRHANNRLLHSFVNRCRDLGLLCGLAGSLGTADIAPLLEVAPDLLGFRGALCRRGQRTEGLDARAVASIRSLIPLKDRTAPTAISVHKRHGPLRRSGTAR